MLSREASALSLLKYFRTDSEVLKLDPVATRMAIQFFVEEAWVRSNESFSLTSVLKQLVLSES